MARNIIVFVADGLRPGSVNPTDTPTLYSIRQNGVNFADSHSLFPTFTTPNASAIATGHYLGDTGDFSNTVYTGYPVPNSNGGVTPFIENDPIIADINSNSNKADPDFSLNNFLTEESLLAFARTQNYSTAAIGKLGPATIQDPTQDLRTDGTSSTNITPKTVVIDDSTQIGSIAKAETPPTSSVTGSQTAVPLSDAIAQRLNAAGLIGTTIPGSVSTANPSGTVAPTIASLRNNQPSGNLTTAGTLNANTQQQQYFADATTKAVLPQFVSDIASGNSKGFAAVYWSRDPDGTQHNNGDAFNADDPGNNSLTIGINGPTPKKAVADADANLAQIIAYLKATPDPANPGKTLYDNTDIFVTADHGFSTISKQAVGVTFDAAGTPTYINTKSYAATLSYAGVHAGFLPPGFVAIDLAKDLGSALYDPDQNINYIDPATGKPRIDPTTNNPIPFDINNVKFAAVDPTKGQRPANGNGVIGGSGTVLNGTIDPNTKVVIAANGGSDLLYVPSNDKTLVARIVSFLSQKDYISGIFTDDKFGDIPGALKLSTIGLKGNAELPTPSIVINFKTFSTNPNDPNDPQAQVEVADTGLQQGQGMHGSFGRGDTFNNMAAIGPDFKSGYVDNAPVSNADVAPTLAKLLGWNIPAKGTLIGRSIDEATVGGPTSAPVTSTTTTSTAVNGISTILKTQFVGTTPYFDVAGFAGGSDGLIPVTLGVMASTPTGTETNSTPGVFTVTSNSKAISDLTFNYTVGGTATNGVDYNKLTGTATIAAGQSSVNIAVTPVDDQLGEGTETAILTLASGSGYSTNPTKASATVSIIDNDLTPVPTSSGNDDLTATPGAKFDGLGNNVFTGAGDDTVDLAINPASGNNRINLGSGKNTVYVSKNDRVFGGAGDDVFDATDSKGGNRMSGGGGNDTFFLGFDDKAIGGSGNDKFYVQSGGGNIISGGGAGNDQFWIFTGQTPTASNTILDFQASRDVIGFTGVGSGFGIGDLSLTGNTIALKSDPSHILATLTGVNTSSLTASNFAFV